MILYKNSFLRSKENRTLIISTFGALITGSITYHFVEGWSWINSIYFSVITLTTVGYGDLAPQTNIGKIFTIFYILAGVGFIFAFINARYQYTVDVKKNKKNRKKKHD